MRSPEIVLDKRWMPVFYVIAMTVKDLDIRRMIIKTISVYVMASLSVFKRASNGSFGNDNMFKYISLFVGPWMIIKKNLFVSFFNNVRFLDIFSVTRGRTESWLLTIGAMISIKKLSAIFTSILQWLGIMRLFATNYMPIMLATVSSTEVSVSTYRAGLSCWGRFALFIKIFPCLPFPVTGGRTKSLVDCFGTTHFTSIHNNLLYGVNIII